MSGVATQIATQISDDNPTFTVRDYGAPLPENLGAGAVLVQVYRITLAPHAQANVLTHTCRVELVVGSKDPAQAEASLEDALDEVLLSLQRMPGISWSTAERSVFNESMNGWTVTCSADSKNIYREHVLAESE